MKQAIARQSSGLAVAPSVPDEHHRTQAVWRASSSRPSLRGLRAECESARVVRRALVRAMFRHFANRRVLMLIAPRAAEAIVAELAAALRLLQARLH